jgi:hypothetical protein
MLIKISITFVSGVNGIKNFLVTDEEAKKLECLSFCQAFIALPVNINLDPKGLLGQTL